MVFPPFFIALEINQLILHNFILDSGAEVNVIPLRLMEQLELKLTRQYNNMCGMDSNPIKSRGIIENLKMKLAAYPEIEINMNVLVLDIPDTWGMLLSREWAAKLGGSIQMDLSYATIAIGENASYKLVNEKPMTKQVETPEHLFEEAMRPTEEVGNYMVMENYWEEP